MIFKAIHDFIKATNRCNCPACFLSLVIFNTYNDPKRYGRVSKFSCTGAEKICIRNFLKVSLRLDKGLFVFDKAKPLSEGLCFILYPDRIFAVIISLPNYPHHSESTSRIEIFLSSCWQIFSLSGARIQVPVYSHSRFRCIMLYGLYFPVLSVY